MNSDEQAIREFFDAWLRASLDGDNDTLKALMAEDVVFLTAEFPPMIGRDAFFAVAGSAPKPYKMEFERDVKEIEISRDWAYAWHWLQVTVTPKEGAAPIRRAGNILSVFHKENGKWVLKRDANLLKVQDDTAN